MAVLLAAGLVHGLLTRSRGAGRVPELMLVYLLVGYCGVAQMAVGATAVVNPDFVAVHMAGVPAGNPIMLWAGFLILGAGIAATMTALLRGTYIVGPVVVWATFWLGATYAHTVADHARGAAMSHGGFLMMFAAHGLVGVVLIVLTVWWLATRRSAST
jgi:hypothetical protein